MPDTVDTENTKETRGQRGPFNRRTLRRWAALALSVVLAPAVVLGLLEAGLRASGYGHSTRFFLQTAFDGKAFHVVNSAFYQQFSSLPVDSIVDLDDLGFEVPAAKRPNTYRVFIFGGSAAHGCTPDVAYGFGRILEVMLKAQFPNVHFEVYNAACPAVNSHVMRYAAQACSKLEPDLFVVYMGNNEFSGPFGPAWVEGRAVSLAFIRTRVALHNLRLTQLLGGEGSSRWFPRKATAREYLEGLNRLRHDAPQKTRMYENFEANLHEICRAGTDAGAAVLLCTVGSNLTDWRPFDSRHRPGLSLADKKQWQAYYEAGAVPEDAPAGQQASAYAQAIQACSQAAEIDETYAELQFRFGRCYWALEQYDKARECLVRARDYDCLPLRADTRTNAIIADTAAKYRPQGVRLVDTVAQLAEHSPHGIEDRASFWDFVHLNFHGSYQVARALFDDLADALPEWLRKQADGGLRPLSQTECERRLALTPAVLLRHARALQPAFSFWGVPEENIVWLEQLIAEFEQQAGQAGLAESVQAYRQALDLAGDDYYLRFRYIEVLLDAENVPEALEQSRLLMSQFPRRRGSHRLRARVLERAGNTQEALATLRSLLEIYPEDAPARLQLGTLLQRTG